MTRAIKWSCFPLLVLVLLATAASSRRVQGKDPGDGGPSRPAAERPAADWWTIPDADFVAQYGNLATGTQEQQSRFAWMAFARANQQVTAPANQQKFSQWELWPSDPETFTPDQPRFEAARKLRTRPHLEPIQQLRMFSHRTPVAAELSPFPQLGEEVTRNPISYDYIMGKGLNTQRGIASYLGQAGNRIDFTVGAVETKAIWVQGARPGAYQSGGLSLTALHLMVKVRPTPSNPFTDNSPSWFWTTFELNSNLNLAAAQRFITYGNTLSAADIQALLSEAGLGGTPFANYVSNGVQIQFADATHPAIVLGNTQLEAGFATPPSRNPANWTKWTSSCHTCHAEASGIVSGNNVSFFGFTPAVGPLAGVAMPPAGYQPYDFVWALSRAQ